MYQESPRKVELNPVGWEVCKLGYGGINSQTGGQKEEEQHCQNLWTVVTSDHILASGSEI